MGIARVSAIVYKSTECERKCVMKRQKCVHCNADVIGKLTHCSNCGILLEINMSRSYGYMIFHPWNREYVPVTNLYDSLDQAILALNWLKTTPRHKYYLANVSTQNPNRLQALFGVQKGWKPRNWWSLMWEPLGWFIKEQLDEYPSFIKLGATKN